MKDFVTVASQSPPVGMTSTKPAAKAAVAPGQDPFELVLQRTSERIERRKPEDVSKSSEMAANEAKDKEPSSAKSSVSEPQDHKEVVTKTKGEEKVEKPDQEAEKDYQAVDEYNIVVLQSENIAVDQKPIAQNLVEVEIGENIVENVSSTTDSSDLMTTKNSKMNTLISMDDSADPSAVLGKEKSLPIDQKSEKSMASGSEIHTDLKGMDSKVESGDLPEFSMLNDKTSPTSPEQNAVQHAGDDNVISFTEKPMNGNVEVKLDTNVDDKNSLSKEIVKGVTTQSEKNVEVLNSVNNKEQVKTFATEKEGKTKTVSNGDAPRNNAPPDNSTVTESGNIGSTVKTSQTNEPARLAEAPRNEVITQVVSQLDQMVKSNRSLLRMQLYPEELGHIELKIVTTKSGVGVTMIADSASTQEILRSEMNSLKQNMQQAGIQLSDLNIGQGQNSNKQQMFEDQQSFPKSTYQTADQAGAVSKSNRNQADLKTTMVDYRI